MGIPKSMLGPNLGLNTVEPPNTGMYWETWKIPSIQGLNLIFLDFDLFFIENFTINEQIYSNNMLKI